MAPDTKAIHPSGVLVAGLFLGLPFFEVVSLSWFRGGLVAVLAAAVTLAVVAWLLLLRPLQGASPGDMDPLADLLTSGALRLVLRAGLILAILLTLDLVIGGWGVSLARWVELRPPQTLLSSLLSWIGAGAMSFGLSAAFTFWAVTGAFRHPWRIQAAVQALGAVALMIFAGVLLTHQRALPLLLATRSGWTSWQFSDLAGPWLYLVCAALVAPALRIEQPGGSTAKTWMAPLAIGLAFMLAAMLPQLWLADFRMSGGGSVGAADAFHLIGSMGRGPLGGPYSGSALLVALASMSTAMVLVFALRRLWMAQYPRLGAAGLAMAASFGWPGLDVVTQYGILHAVALGLSSLAGIAVVRRAMASNTTGRRLEWIAAVAGFAFAVLAWQSDERALDFLPFFASALLTVVGTVGNGGPGRLSSRQGCRLAASRG